MENPFLWDFADWVAGRRFPLPILLLRVIGMLGGLFGNDGDGDGMGRFYQHDQVLVASSVAFANLTTNRLSYKQEKVERALPPGGTAWPNPCRTVMREAETEREYITSHHMRMVRR